MSRAAERKQSTIRTLAVLVPVILGSSALGVAGVCLVRIVVPPAVLASSNDVMGNYLQTLGSIYAVLLAFVVYVVWTQFNDARTFVEREANDLQGLFRTLQAMGARDVAEPLPRYVTAVLDEEWDAMSARNEAVLDRTGRILDEVWERLYCLEPANEWARALHADGLARFHDLSDARTERLTCARTRIPLALRLLLYVGAAVLVGSFFFVGVERFAIHAFVAGAMAGAVGHVLYLIYDLDDAFAGAWQVSRAPFERARRFMAGAT